MLFAEGLLRDQFQSTLPRRERQMEKIRNYLNCYFNPRSRGGSDAKEAPAHGQPGISIHAPAEGATIHL